MSLIIAHITDFHVGRIIETDHGPIDLHDRMLQAVAHLKNLDPQPDLVMLTGDLSNHGREKDYFRVFPAITTAARRCVKSSPATVISLPRENSSITLWRIIP
jgi:3',5'-cyclic AMP phosphodiesterase CpdA